MVFGTERRGASRPALVLRAPFDQVPISLLLVAARTLSIDA